MNLSIRTYVKVQGCFKAHGMHAERLKDLYLSKVRPFPTIASFVVTLPDGGV